MKNPTRGTIIVATDGSPDALRAVQWAAEQAALEHRPLVVAAAEAAAEESAALAHQHRPGLSVSTVILTEEPREALIALSQEAHLLVLGSRGRGPFLSTVLGSVSADISRYAACPVVVCRPGLSSTVRWGVVAGADGTAESLPVIDFAFRQAALHSRPLTVMHCYWDVVDAVGRPPTADSPSPAERAKLLLAETLAGFRETYPDVRVTEQFVQGATIDQLVSAAETHDLVVIGRHPVENLFDRVTGSVSTAVLERAHTTVAVIPEQWGA